MALRWWPVSYWKRKRRGESSRRNERVNCRWRQHCIIIRYKKTAQWKKFTASNQQRPNQLSRIRDFLACTYRSPSLRRRRGRRSRRRIQLQTNSSWRTRTCRQSTRDTCIFQAKLLRFCKDEHARILQSQLSGGSMVSSRRPSQLGRFNGCFLHRWWIQSKHILFLARAWPATWLWLIVCQCTHALHSFARWNISVQGHLALHWSLPRSKRSLQATYWRRKHRRRNKGSWPRGSVHRLKLLGERSFSQLCNVLCSLCTFVLACTVTVIH